MNSSLLPEAWTIRPDLPVVILGCLAVALAGLIRWRQTARGWPILLVLAAVATPFAYVDAVANAVKGRLAESLSQGRAAQAYNQASLLIGLQPGAEIGGIPLARIRADLKTACKRLERAARPQFTTEGQSAHLQQRLTALLQLDRPAEALRLLHPLRPTADPIVFDFLGLCYQRLNQPQASLTAYGEAFEGWQRQPPGPARDAGMANALKGRAFALRQLDQRAAEEAAYRALVSLDNAPSNLLLLARCYYEQGRTAAAVAVLNQLSKTTADTELLQQASGMARTMQRDHFGCFHVPWLKLSATVATDSSATTGD